MAQVIGSNVSGHLPIGDKPGATHTPPFVAGSAPATYVVPSSAAITINGTSTPKIDMRMHSLSNIVDFINGLFTTGVTASIDRYGRISMSHPVAITIGGDAATRTALGI